MLKAAIMKWEGYNKNWEKYNKQNTKKKKKTNNKKKNKKTKKKKNTKPKQKNKKKKKKTFTHLLNFFSVCNVLTLDNICKETQFIWGQWYRLPFL